MATVSLVGHSLGSLIVFDLLSHQHDEDVDASNQLKSNVKKIEDNYESLEQFLDKLKLAEFKAIFEKEMITLESLVRMAVVASRHLISDLSFHIRV